MRRVDHVSVAFEDNGRLHDDLVLRIGTDCRRCDSYYLWSERSEQGDDPAAVVRAALARLTDQWVAAINDLSAAGPCFLPFDFSDQCTRWLRCAAQGDDVVIQPGWSSVEGWSFAPSDVGPLLTRLPDFRAEGDPFVVGRHVLLRTLRSPSQ